jgi:hypothetical protein
MRESQNDLSDLISSGQAVPEAADRPRWIAKLQLEQSRRWRRGERFLVEDYRQLLPMLQGEAELLLDLIYNEIVLREQIGETPTLEEYLKRFPEHAEALRLQFEVHLAFPPLSIWVWPGWTMPVVWTAATP